jgi:hypothetical protein
MMLVAIITSTVVTIVPITTPASTIIIVVTRAALRVVLAGAGRDTVGG